MYRLDDFRMKPRAGVTALDITFGFVKCTLEVIEFYTISFGLFCFNLICVYFSHKLNF